MPSLLRFLGFLAVLGGLVFGAMWALATFVEPKQRDMSVNVPAERLQPPR